MSQPRDMQAPSIPNLLSLRGSNRGLRGRNRGRGGHSGERASSQAQQDATVQGTDTDAAVMRMSAVELGYLDDRFAQYFVQGQQPHRRLPIINRGTYTRTTALDRLIDSFLGHDPGGDEPLPRRQIVSLGAGTDTRCFRLFSSQDRRRGLIYHEVDFPPISSRKRMVVQATPALRSVLPDPVPSNDGPAAASWRSTPEGDGNQYWCHGLDLRDLAMNSDQGDLLLSRLEGLRTDVPTLLISECCLCYLETSEAQNVIKCFVNRIPDLGLVVYEPVRPDDAFGRQMASNLAARKIRMPTLEAYRQPKDQEGRLREAGFKEVRQKTVDSIWSQWVSEDEKERVDGLEGLDEVEEWQLLAGHYIVAWGWKGPRLEAMKGMDIS
ncbi:leucine carboxyl methyltransferase 1 [Diaporthe helianthi]|uniref:Leucine carboxyl methyltransferase 1 n=1 Tax=Diaporthe helianthi TaxID=158607 RepID=A0A2P5IB48_DIAHE|nr:leucine carboxyl methyltransferase 1 [Diaporthe helianthi]